MHLIDRELRSDLVGSCFRVAGQHHGLRDAVFLKLPDSLRRMLLDDIRDYDMTFVLSVNRHMNNRTALLAGLPLRADVLHHARVADTDGFTAHLRADAAPRNLRHIFNTAAVLLVRISFPQCRRDRMCGIAFHMRRHMQQLLLVQPLRMHRGDGEFTACERACFIENNGLRLRKNLQIIRPFHKNAFFRRAADARKERKRNTDDQRARAADYQERKRPVCPGSPCGVHAKRKEQKRWKHRERNCRINHCRRINSGELRDEILGFRLAGARVFDQLENL